MKFVLSTLLTLVSVAYCQQATVLHPKDKETKIGDGYKCYKNSTGIAKGVKGKSSIELQFFKNDNCDGKYYRKAWGTINFKKSFKYYSVKLEKHKKKKDTKSESVEEDTEENGAEEGVAEDDETSVKSVDESDTEAGEDDDGAGSEQSK